MGLATAALVAGVDCSPGAMVTRGQKMPPKISNGSSGIATRRARALAEKSGVYRERRDDLYAAAIEVFRKKGLRDATLKEIGEHAKMDRATVYYYHSDKIEIFHAVTQSAVRDVVRVLENISVLPLPPTEKLERAVGIYIQEDLSRVVTRGDAGSSWEHDMLELSRHYEHMVTTIVSDGLADGSLSSSLHPKVIAHGIMGMANWMYRWYRPDGPQSGDEIGQGFATIVLNGLRSG
jgi:AcrR family transcriptional regulator